MPLSTSTYGKASAMATSLDFADRITAVLENAHGALDKLDQSNRTGAVADQGAVNLLRKVIQDMGTIAVDARNAAVEDSQPDPNQVNSDANRAAADSGTAKDSDSKTAASSGSAKS